MQLEFERRAGRDRGAEQRDRDAALALFAALRSANLRLLAGAGPSGLERVGVHEERGDETVRHMIRLYAGHDLVHRNQLSRLGARFA